MLWLGSRPQLFGRCLARPLVPTLIVRSDARCIEIGHLLPSKGFLESHSRNVPKPATFGRQWLTKMSSPSAPRLSNVAVSRRAHTTKRPR